MSTLCLAERKWQVECIWPQRAQRKKVFSFVFFALQYVRITHRREDFFLQKAKNERKGLCPQNTQMDADEEFLFRICVNRRILRASPDSVAAGRAVFFVVKNVFPQGCRRISDNRKYFGNISEKQPFSEIISDLFFWERDRPGRCAGRLAPHFRSKMCLAGRQTPRAGRTRSQSNQCAGL